MTDDLFSRKKRPEPPPPAGGWEITFCALVLILVAFFAMLVSYSSIEDEKVTNFMRGFAGEARMGIDRPLERDDAGWMPSPGERIHLPAKEVKALESETIMLAFRRLERAARLLGPTATEAVSIETTEKGFKAILKGDLLFASGTAEIQPAFRPYLDELGELLRDSGLQARIEGHTDSVPIATVRYPSNWELSTARAVSVVRYLLEQTHISAERLEAVGFGEYRPVEDNETPEGRARNRRVECYFETVSAEPPNRSGGGRG